MYVDPWDLKHEIQQKEKQLYHSKLMKGQQNSSNKYTQQLQQSSMTKQEFSNKLTDQPDEQEETHSDQNSISKPLQKEQYIKSLNSTHTINTDIQFCELPKIDKKRNKYGNMLVCFQSKRFLLSIGPNYLFFFFAYLCFTGATIYLVSLVNQAMDSYYFKLFNFAFCWLQNLSYILVALSNPGVQLPANDNQITEEDIKSNRYCKKCRALQKRKTYHCRQCDICINDYDHHCPWTSKCIGGGNLKRFYFFVCMTPFYIFYYMVVFMICMANITVTHSKNLRNQPPTF